MKIAIGNLNISASLEYDPNTGEVIVKGLSYDFEKVKASTVKTLRILNATEEEYKIFTLGASNPVAQALPLGTDIKVIFQDKEYDAKSHTKTKGRVGLANFFNDWPLKEGTLVEVEYAPDSRTMEIKVIELPE